MRYKPDEDWYSWGSDWGVCLEVFSGLWYQQQQRSRYEKEKLSFDVVLRFSVTLTSQVEGRKIQIFWIHSIQNSSGNLVMKRRLKFIDAYNVPATLYLLFHSSFPPNEGVETKAERNNWPRLKLSFLATEIGFESNSVSKCSVHSTTGNQSHVTFSEFCDLSAFSL